MLALHRLPGLQQRAAGDLERAVTMMFATLAIVLGWADRRTNGTNNSSAKR
jgi:hypothetical protein